MTEKTRVVLNISRPGIDEATAEINQIQVSISEIDEKGLGTGYRLAGPKITGRQVPISQVELDERDVAAIRRVLDAAHPQASRIAELEAENARLTRATQELLHALQLAVVTIRAAWVEAEHIGPAEGIEVLEDVMAATAPDLPNLDQYGGAQDVFDAEYTVADRSADAKRLRARLAAKEA